MKKKILLIYISIILIAVSLRFYQLDKIPPGINRDEGSIAYTAYSLLATGKDEYQRPYPISFESFGDWKLPFYIYSVVPFISFFGLTELAVRLPSAIFGVGTVVLTYFLVLELFSKWNIKHLKQFALLTTLLVAISPWHLHLSRVESESNTAVFFVTLGVLFFLKSLRIHWLIVPGFASLALTYFIYAGNHLFTTLLVLGMGFLYRKDLFKNRWKAWGILVYALLSGIIFYNTLFGANVTKLSGIGIFGDISLVHKIELSRNEHSIPTSIFPKLIHNRVVFSIDKIVQNYLNSFSPQFLFEKGGNNRAHNIMNFGNMYLWEAPFLLFGFIYLLRSKKTREKYLIIFWFLIAPIAASITKDAPHTNRMFAIFPILPIITAFGVYESLRWVRQKIKKLKLVTYSFICVLTLVVLMNFLIYIDKYYVHFPKNEVANWGFAYKELYKYLSNKENESKFVIMTHPESSPYIFLLFYGQYDPEAFQGGVMRYPYTNDGFLHVQKYDRFEFKEVYWRDAVKKYKKVLIVDKFEDVPYDVRKSYRTFDIKPGNGKAVFTVVHMP